MSVPRRVFALSVFLAWTQLIFAQQPTTAQGFITAALASMGASGIESASLSGNSEFIAGSTDETGAFTAQCATNGSSQLQLQIASNSRAEIRQTSNGTPTGSWVDSSGNSHTMAGHNLLTPALWFCPNVALVSFIQNQQSLNMQLVGETIKNGISVVQISIAAAVPDSSPSSLLTAHLTQTTVYLNSVTLQPVAFDFNIHPDNSATTDIPVEIQFSNFSNASGVSIPYTIRKFVNSTLALSLQVLSATVTAANSQAQ